MSFHTEKCSILRVHRKRAPVIFNYSLKGHTLTCDESTKFLGVEISQDMSWKLHIDKAVKKGSSTLGFLRRNLRINSEDVKSAAYISLVRPNLEYCSTIWNPYHKDQIYKLEMVQRRAAWYATNRYHNTSSVSEMLDHLNWETLESRRTKAQLTMMFRIVNSLVDVPLEQYLTPASSRTRSAHSHKFRQISTTTSYYKNSFSLALSLHGILCHQLLLRPLTWYPSSRGCPPLSIEPAVGASHKKYLGILRAMPVGLPYPLAVTVAGLV